MFGISEIPKLPLSTFVENVKIAKHIQILETFTDLANNDILFEKFSEAIKEALRGDSRIEILLIHPESEAAKQRAEELSRAIKPIKDVPELIQKTLARFYRLETEKVGKDKIGTLEIKLYDAFPTIAMHKWDQEAYISFYPVNQRSDEAPNLKVSTLTTFGSYAASKFDELWNEDSAIPLSSYMRLRVEVQGEPEELLYYAFENTNRQALYASCKFKDNFFSALEREKLCIVSFGKDKYEAEHTTLRLLDEKLQAIELINKRYDWKEREKYIDSDPRVFQIKLLKKKTN
ncbi:hypothetical protein WA1_35770 [Scytonema hofmannii PCC 7110]|uniref:Uncharacterized protein n=1 Tax=Scytonema hofmannii PCC 7110 TaxID=128403 RepID=A0A139X1G0_9CYAN|nr:hypothetical protein [Scytonema hofmannii]KYC38547.1 hypothetical protein WA1_35770 [Scytonema hofmannii PCC 7110]